VRRIDAQKFYARINDNGAFIIDPYHPNYNHEWPEVTLRAMPDRDYRLLLAVARAADTWERSGQWVDSVAVAEAVDRLNAKTKGKRT
jgi:hypothetical protein